MKQKLILFCMFLLVLTSFTTAQLQTLQTTGANYSINLTSGHIRSIVDSFSNQELLNQTGTIGKWGCGWNSKNFSTTLDSPSSFDTSLYTLIYNDSKNILLQKNRSNYYMLLNFSVDNDYLKIKADLKNQFGGIVPQGNWIFICFFNNYFLTGKNITPFNDDFQASTGSLNIGVDSRKINRGAAGIGSVDNLFTFNKTYGLYLSIEKNWFSYDNNYFQYPFSVPYTLTQAVQNLYFDINDTKSFIYNLDFEKDIGTAKNKVYRKTIDSTDKGSFLDTCSLTVSISNNNLSDAYNAGTRIWEMGGIGPRNGLYPQDISATWQGTDSCIGGMSLNYPFIQNLANLAKSNNVKSYLYFNPIILNKTYAMMYYPSDIATNSSKDPYCREIPCDYVLMSFENKAGYYKNLTDTIIFLMDTGVPNISGVFFDQTFYARYLNFNSTTPNFNATNTVPGKLYSPIMNGFEDFVQNISIELQRRNKTIILNAVPFEQFSRYSSGFLIDSDDLTDMRDLKVISLDTPLYFVSLAQNLSFYLNQSIMWGVYPEWSVTNANRKPNAYNFSLIDRVAKSSLLSYGENQSNVVPYVLYNDTITSETTFSITPDSPKIYYILNNHHYPSLTASSSYSHIQYDDGLTDVIMYQDNLFYYNSNDNPEVTFVNNTIITFTNPNGEVYLYDGIDGWFNITNSNYLNLSIRYAGEVSNLSLNYIGDKKLIIANGTITILNLTPPYNDIRINGVVSALNQLNYSITLNPGDLVEVSDFTYCGDGIVQSPNDNSSFMEDCDGANLNSQTCLSVGFTKGTLSCNSCSFVTTDCQAKSQLCQDNLVPLSGMTTWLGLLVTIICIAFVFILFTNNSINLKLEGDAFYATILIVISVGFLLGVGILILSNLC